MKKVLSIVATLSMANASYCATPLRLEFETTDGGTVALDAAALKMSVDGNNLSVNNGSQSETFVLTNLTKMYFTGDMSTIEQALAQSPDVQVKVYSINGNYLGNFPDFRSARRQLEKGVYLVTQGSKTFKVKL